MKEANYPRATISDSLIMGDHAVSMCKDGAESIACLGVDFMAESVSAILDKNGFGHVPVYRAKEKFIGCTLAESAEKDAYRAWLHRARDQGGKALHVVYINTSLETKAVSSSIVPTITCTSSNVVRTMLQAAAQVGPDLKIYYGPDTYMGENLRRFFQTVATWDDKKIASELHPAHNSKSIHALIDGLDVFPSGNCLVHHMFGSDVVDTIRTHYDDAYVTAHLEVPGEMFEIAMEKSLEGRGGVGSTSYILKFISSKISAAVEKDTKEHTCLKFILGTEAGMVTSIVRSINDILDKHGSDNVEAEIIFPVASEAVFAVEDDEDFAVVPGVSGGEGCSTSGGCATCPYMKMNDVDSLIDIADMVLDKDNKVNRMKLIGHQPADRLKGKMLGGKKASDLGTEPILFMRHLMKESSLPDELMQRIVS